MIRSLALAGLVLLAGCNPPPVAPPECPKPPPSALCRWSTELAPFLGDVEWLLGAKNARVVSDLSDAVSTECGPAVASAIVQKVKR